MYKGTTPTFTFTFPPDFDPTTADQVILTFSANKKDPLIEKDDSELEINSDSIYVSLTQEETLSIPVGRLYCQINFFYDDGSRASTDIQIINIDHNLHNRVIQ